MFGRQNNTLADQGFFFPPFSCNRITEQRELCPFCQASSKEPKGNRNACWQATLDAYLSFLFNIFLQSSLVSLNTNEIRTNIAGKKRPIVSNPPLTRNGGRNRSFQGLMLLVALTVGGSVEAMTRGPDLGGTLGAQAWTSRLRWEPWLCCACVVQRRHQSEVLQQHTLAVASLKSKAAI